MALLPTQASSVLIDRAQDALTKIWPGGSCFPFKRCGIELTELTPDNQEQLDIFCRPDRRQEELAQLLDRINERFGVGALRYAAEGRNETGWAMRRDRLSPVSTLDWKKTPVVG